MASSKTRVDIPSKLIATIVIAFVLAWLVTTDEKNEHVAKVPKVCPNGTVQGIEGRKCYRYFSSGNANDEAEKKCEASAEVKGCGQSALIESKAQTKPLKEIPRTFTLNPGRMSVSRDSDVTPTLGEGDKLMNETAKNDVHPAQDEIADRVWIGWNGKDKGTWSDGSSFAVCSNWAPEEPNLAHSKSDENNKVALLISPDPYAAPLFKNWTARAAKAKLDGVMCKRHVPVAGKCVPQ